MPAAAEPTAPLTRLRSIGACRLVPSRYPPVGLLDRVARPEDLDALFELESWTNDRVSQELGILHGMPRDEWVTGRPMASIVMAPFCHPHPQGGRFNGTGRGAWYAARRFETALAESIYHRTRELTEVGSYETRVEVRLYLADFRSTFHDIRERSPRWVPLYDPASYEASRRFAATLLESGSHGLAYGSVRHPGGECLACFRPALVLNARAGAHFEYRWEGTPVPRVRRLPQG